MNETFSIKTACPPVSIPFCRLIKRKTKIFRPFDRLVLFRLPPLPRPCWKLPGTDLELISTKRLPWLPPFFSTPVFLFPLPSFLPLFFSFVHGIQRHVHPRRSLDEHRVARVVRSVVSEPGRIKIRVKGQGTTTLTSSCGEKESVGEDVAIVSYRVRLREGVREMRGKGDRFVNSGKSSPT